MKVNLKRILSGFVSLVVVSTIYIPQGFMNAKAIWCAKDGFDKSRYTLTGNTAEDVATIAKSQKGRFCDDFGYSGVDWGAWCDEYVADCLENAGCDSSIVAHGGTVADFAYAMRQRGAIQVSTPQTGDLVFFTYSHVEIVTKVENGVVYSAGGNNNDPNTHSYHDGGCCAGEHLTTSVSYYLRPNYDKNHIYIPPEVTSPPIDGWIWSDKNVVQVGEEISFNFNATGATDFYLGIYKNGEFQPVVANGTSDWYTTSFAEPGTYSIHAACYNGYGHCDSPELEFVVYDSPPTEAWIWSDKTKAQVGEEISFNFNAKGATDFYLGIYKDGEFQPVIANGTSDWYTTSFTEPGIYSIHAACYNGYGHCDSPELVFTIYDPSMEMIPNGDCNNDGKFNISDVVLLQKWLLAVPDTHFENWKAADMCEDDRLDVFDLCLMKRQLIYGSDNK